MQLPASQWQEFKDTDAYAGQDVHKLRTTDFDYCKQLCQERNFGGFVHWKGTAYFRQHARGELLANRVFSRYSTLYVRPEIPVVTAIILDEESPAAALGSTPSDTAPAAAPVVPREVLPPKPVAFQELARLSEAELRHMQANELAVDDWIMELPQVRDFNVKALDVREANCKLAKDILARQAELDSASAQCDASCRTLAQQREVVGSVYAKYEEIRKQHSPSHIGGILAARAQEVDAQGEESLQEALDAQGTMSASALAAFRQRYVKQKSEKHCLLAAKERLEVSGSP
mmetsp:Transcript_8285/g.18918  ORF Transcript_8285/g.18918 Transcript_8285/m.18918 type:complete len:288 (-) Transcript_8285:178-1041(-)